MMGSKRANSRTAKLRGQTRARRRKRAERRAATADVRTKINAKKRSENHPGWVERLPRWMR